MGKDACGHLTQIIISLPFSSCFQRPLLTTLKQPGTYGWLHSWSVQRSRATEDCKTSLQGLRLLATVLGSLPLTCNANPTLVLVPRICRPIESAQRYTKIQQFFFQDFIYLFMRHRERDAETQVEGEAGSLQGSRWETQSQDFGITS